MLKACGLKLILVAGNVFLGLFIDTLKYDYKGFTDVSAILHYLSDKRLPYIICGDININLLQHTSSSSVHKYIETYESYNC